MIFIFVIIYSKQKISLISKEVIKTDKRKAKQSNRKWAIGTNSSQKKEVHAKLI